MSQMEEAWNKNPVGEFKTFWISVIGKIMMECYNKFPLGSSVLGGNHIILEMSAIQSAVGLTQFCGDIRLSRGRTHCHSWDQSFTWISEELFCSFFLCIILSFLQVELLWWT